MKKQNRNTTPKAMTPLANPFPAGFKPFGYYPVRDAFPHASWATSPYLDTYKAKVPVQIPKIDVTLSKGERAKEIKKYVDYMDMERRKNIRAIAGLALMKKIPEAIKQREEDIDALKIEIKSLEDAQPKGDEPTPELKGLKQRLERWQGLLHHDCDLRETLAKIAAGDIVLPRSVRLRRQVNIYTETRRDDNARHKPQLARTEWMSRIVDHEAIFEHGLETAFRYAEDEWVSPDSETEEEENWQ